MGVGRATYVSVARAEEALAALLAGNAEAGLEAAYRARALAEEVAKEGNRVERDFVRAEWLIGAALVGLAEEGGQQRDGHLAEAEAHLTEALTRCRGINLMDTEPDILLTWAHWFRARGDVQEAQEYAAEALSIADRCEYRLKQADIHNFLAALDMEEDSQDDAVEHATTAYERAWCDGPPHCYKPALDQAERLLKELDVEPPEMPEYAG